MFIAEECWSFFSCALLFTPELLEVYSLHFLVWKGFTFAIITTSCIKNNQALLIFKGIVHFDIKMWYLSAYPKGIQDVGVFFSSVDPILMFLGQTVLVCQSYNGRYRSLSL